MEWTKPRQFDESAQQRVEHVGFDVLRAIASARQSATPTARALQDSGTMRVVQCANPTDPAGPIQTLIGLAAQYGGAFRETSPDAGQNAPSRDNQE